LTLVAENINCEGIDVKSDNIEMMLTIPDWHPYIGQYRNDVDFPD
jgi:hypothetical protein